MEWNQSDVMALAMEKCASLRRIRNAAVEQRHRMCVQLRVCAVSSAFVFNGSRLQSLRKEIIGRPNLEHTSSPARETLVGEKR